MRDERTSNTQITYSTDIKSKKEANDKCMRSVSRQLNTQKGRNENHITFSWNKFPEKVKIKHVSISSLQIQPVRKQIYSEFLSYLIYCNFSYEIHWYNQQGTNERQLNNIPLHIQPNNHCKISKWQKYGKCK